MYITLRDAKVTGVRHPDRRRPVARVVILLGVVSMLTDISSEAVTAILPLYLTSVVGLSVVAFGFLDGLYQGVSAVTRIAAGYASDRGDRPKWVAVGGYALSMLARVGLVVSTGLGQITAVVTADRIGKGIRTAPRDAMISASSGPDNAGRSFGVHRALDTCGAVIGPLLASLVLWVVADGYDIVLAVSLAFAVLGVAVLVLVVPDVRPRAEAAQRELAPTGATAPPVRLRSAFTPHMRRLLVAAGVLSLVTVGDGFLYLALVDRGDFAAHWFPLLYVGTSFAYMALAVPAGRLADRVGRIRVFVAAHGLLLLAYLVAMAPTSMGLATLATVVVLLLLGAFYAGTDGVLAALAGRVAPAEARASGIASAQTVVAVARLVSSTGFGLLWFLLGPSAALVVVGALLSVLMVPAYLMLRPLQAVGA